jgi:molybdopterin-guanine dinucleotide biosynthesis protein
MNLLKMSNILLLAGSGRNVGKTTFGCRIVSQTAVQHKTIAVKISSHPHPVTQGLRVLAGTADAWFIAEETAPEGNKDSMRYRQAGAHMSLYAMASGDTIDQVLQWITQNFDNRTALVIESGTFGVLAEPGLAFFLGGDGLKQPQWCFDYVRLKTYDDINNFDLQSVKFENGVWRTGY